MKKFIGLVLFFGFLSLHSQSDSLKYAKLDSLTPEQLLEYYINEPEPYDFPKGPVTVGDSLYNILNSLTASTGTFDLESTKKDSAKITKEENYDTPDYQYKPKISLSMGRLSFYGDIYQKNSRSPLVGRPAFDLAISQRLTRYLQLNFSVLFGKLGADEWRNNRHENFQSEIRAGGLNFMYDFGNFIPDHYRVRPFVSIGVMGFEFLSKADLKDANGNTYYYWSDGSIKNMPQNAPGAQNAVNLTRDYKYETDIRQLNKDGFGKYPERAWAFPLGMGFVAKVTDRVDFKMNFQFYLTTTDYIDGITNKSVGDRMGNKHRDNFAYTSVSLQYDLITKRRPLWYGDTVKYRNMWLADNSDDDKDGVIDLQDDCLGTEAGAPVDNRGCPLDDDKDGVPNFRDDELATPAGNPVNERGVSQNEKYWSDWYARYLNDTLPTDVTTEVIVNWFALQKRKSKKEEKQKDLYTVELTRYSGPIPEDELAFLMSIGDINSTILDDGVTTVYTTGNYEKLSMANKRRDEFKKEGIMNVGISKVKGKSVIPVPDTELESLLEKEIKDLSEMNVNASANSNKEDTEEMNNLGNNGIVYRVQLGAFKNRISSSVFNTSAGVVELSTGGNVFRYVTKGYKTLQEAASIRADLIIEGYHDAFITAYKGGKRIPLSEAGATVAKDYKEDVDENKMFSSVNKNLVVFKVQLGPNKKQGAQVKEMDEQIKSLEGVERQLTSSGSMRYTIGNFSTWDEAETYRRELQGQGFSAAFVIATFKNEIITKVEALELTK